MPGENREKSSVHRMRTQNALRFAASGFSDEVGGGCEEREKSAARDDNVDDVDNDNDGNDDDIENGEDDRGAKRHF